MKPFIFILLSGCVLAALAPVQGGEKGTVVEIDEGLKSTAPAHWVMQKPENKFRAWQFAIPPAEGDAKGADMVIYYFGPGAAAAQANIERWKSQFRAPEGKSIDDVTKVAEKKIGQTYVTYVDIQGIYLHKFPPFDPNAKVTPLSGYRQIAVVFDSKKGPYFMKLTGPEKTVTANKKAFDDWLAGLK